MKNKFFRLSGGREDGMREGGWLVARLRFVGLLASHGGCGGDTFTRTQNKSLDSFLLSPGCRLLQVNHQGTRGDSAECVRVFLLCEVTDF